ncbi:MAG: SDR family NAD(P)-dependent oxidoreductase [Candidatus Hodarchaeota archaeon]
MIKDKVAIVTGASRGIGRATALLFGLKGAKVVVNYYRSESMAEEVVEEIRKEGGTAIAIQANVGDRDAVKQMVDKSLRKFSRVDILINNAAVLMGSGSLLDFNDDEFDSMWQVNVKGILYCSRAIVPHMMKNQYGKIVNIASIAGFGTSRLPGNMLYASTKAAVVILTKRLALELGQYGINVNAIAPGLIRTDMGMGGRSTSKQEERLKYFEEKSILGRIGEPEEVANAALFLASDKASFITGQVLTVDGGRIDFISHSL